MMNNNLNLLILEDDEKLNKLFNDDIEDINKTSDVKIIPCITKTVDEAKELLKRKYFDAAIIDLKLRPEDRSGEGNRIIKAIKKDFRSPIFIFSAFPEQLSPKYQQDDIFIKIYKKTDIKNKPLLKEIIKIFNTGITKILGGKGILENYLHRIFWKHIYNDLALIEGHPESEKILLRKISIYLNEYLDLTETGDPDYYHPVEMYIYPPIKKYIFTGDIIQNKISKRYYIVLTPTCDMVLRKPQGGVPYRKADRFILVSVKMWKEIEDFKNIRVDDISNSKMKEIEKFIKNNKKNNYHFLPPHNKLPGAYIDFQSLSSVSPSTGQSVYKRIATISGPFLKDIVSRFSQYYSRQGQPDLDIELTTNLLTEK